ncbi:glycosyltransferase family 4 protein [Calditerricola satsumensis]|uniref:glycosyltransferase family 4 protein n=1 Tax=Calditerricola satsumensis TaxID=373054 RepID=UPI001C49019C|nr:glycosyltransferase family 1 protein [Calditerricola satsumensis]
MWEQFVLPLQVGNRLLWSPANTGPLAISRQVVTIHDAATLVHPEWFDPRFALWYRFLLPRLMRRVLRVITVSEFSRQQLVEYGGAREEDIVVIPNGVDRRFKPASEEEIYSLRLRFRLMNPYILVVGSLEPRKNLRRLFMAWEQVQPILQEVDLVVAGSDGKVFRSLGFDHVPANVRLIGYVKDKDLPVLYSGAEVFVYPSLYEGFGLPPLEAMACGTPVITSNISALPEVVGDAALLVDPYCEESIATGILKVMEDRIFRENLRKSGLERSKLFTWDRTAELTWRVLKEVGA